MPTIKKILIVHKDTKQAKLPDTHSLHTHVLNSTMSWAPAMIE